MYKERSGGNENCTVHFTAITLFYPGAFPRGLAKNKGKTLRIMRSQPCNTLVLSPRAQLAKTKEELR